LVASALGYIQSRKLPRFRLQSLNKKRQYRSNARCVLIIEKGKRCCKNQFYRDLLFCVIRQGSGWQYGLASELSWWPACVRVLLWPDHPCDGHSPTGPRGGSAGPTLAAHDRSPPSNISLKKHTRVHCGQVNHLGAKLAS